MITQRPWYARLGLFLATFIAGSTLTLLLFGGLVVLFKTLPDVSPGTLSVIDASFRGLIVGGVLGSLAYAWRFLRPEREAEQARTVPCIEIACGAPARCTGTVLGKTSYRCDAGHEFIA